MFDISWLIFCTAFVHVLGETRVDLQANCQDNIEAVEEKFLAEINALQKAFEDLRHDNNELKNQMAELRTQVLQSEPNTRA